MWKITDIPWSRLTTPYGRGTKIPEYISQKMFQEIGKLIEHQETFWQVTPWTTYFLLQEMKITKEKFLEILLTIFERLLCVCHEYEISEVKSTEIVDAIEELLTEKYLWKELLDIEKEEKLAEDEMSWEEEIPRGYEQKCFISYYWYTYQFILFEKEWFKRYQKQTMNKKISNYIKAILNYID